MKFELPYFKRCCCCVPLRYGLIAWGYIKLVALTLLMVPISINLQHIRVNRRPNDMAIEISIVSAICVLTVLDFTMMVIMLIGAHQKNVKLLRIYFIYGVGYFLLSALLYILSLVANLLIEWANMSTVWMYLTESSSLELMIVGLNFYLVTLVHSEVVKLRSNEKFQFVNLAADRSDAITA